MKRLLLAIAITGLSLVSVSAQVKTSATTGQPRDLAGTTIQNATSRVRVLGRSGQTENQSEAGRAKSSPAAFAGTQGNLSNAATKSAWGDAPVINSVNSSVTGTRPRITNDRALPSTTASQTYRVGVGDVLDVQLVDTPTTNSTLFTVLAGGMLEYPLAGDPMRVAGLTADEIAIHLRARVRVFENPQVEVKVRAYASHNVVISGLVSDPGAKFLRREAIPFYAVLAEAQPRPEAVRATLLRSGQPAINIDLNDQGSASTLVLPGDVIKVLGPPLQPVEYFYVGGAISSPGQKPFHSGLTLMQAIIASGGLTHAAGSKVKVSRQGADGRLTTTEYKLRQIEDGKTPDPKLQPGDRIAIL